MKCVILAAGEGLRMRPLTNNEPKPMLKVAGKPLLEHIFNDLPEEISETVLVVGYLRDRIINHFGSKFGKFMISYIVQDNKKGTFNALELCKSYLDNEEKFLMMYADDLYGANNIAKLLEKDEYSILVHESKNPERFGVVEVDSEGFVSNIEEKPTKPKSNLVSIGPMILDSEVFKFPARPKPNGEYYLTDSIEQMIEAGYRFTAVESSRWLPIGYPEDLGAAEKFLRSGCFPQD